MVTFTIYGSPTTKKTSNVLARAGGRHIILPAKRWRDWVKHAEIVCGIGKVGSVPVAEFDWLTPLPDRPWNCAATFYRERNVGDLVGYMQGLADLLEKRGIISNDKWITGWDGSRLDKDKNNPRVEVTLTEVGP